MALGLFAPGAGNQNKCTAASAAVPKKCMRFYQDWLGVSARCSHGSWTSAVACNLWPGESHRSDPRQYSRYRSAMRRVGGIVSAAIGPVMRLQRLVDAACPCVKPSVMLAKIKTARWEQRKFTAFRMSWWADFAGPLGETISNSLYLAPLTRILSP